MEAPYFLPNGSGGWEDFQIVGGVHEVYPYHVYMVPGEYVGIFRQFLLQLGLLFFDQEGTGIGTLSGPPTNMGCRGSIANCSLSSEAAQTAGLNCYEDG